MHNPAETREAQAQVIPAGSLEIIGHILHRTAHHGGVHSHDPAEVEVIADGPQLAVDQPVGYRIAAAIGRRKEIGIHHCRTGLGENTEQSVVTAVDKGHVIVREMYEYRTPAGLSGQILHGFG